MRLVSLLLLLLHLYIFVTIIIIFINKNQEKFKSAKNNTEKNWRKNKNEIMGKLWVRIISLSIWSKESNFPNHRAGVNDNVKNTKTNSGD